MYRALLGVSKVFVLIEKAMYRTLLATCGSTVFRCLYSLQTQCTARCLQRVAQRKCWLIDNYFKEYKHLKTAEQHEQRAVHFFSAQFAIKNPPE